MGAVVWSRDIVRVRLLIERCAKRTVSEKHSSTDKCTVVPDIIVAYLNISKHARAKSRGSIVSSVSNVCGRRGE